jgi:hypothetical protein
MRRKAKPWPKAHAAGELLPGVLCVDPGLDGTGLAWWRTLVARRGPARPPSWTAVIRSTAGGSWEDRAEEITGKALWRLGKALRADDRAALVVIETPRLWGGSATSYASAAKGDLFKLAFLAGSLAHALRRKPLEAGALDAITPGQWKGQLSKKLVDARIRRALGPGARYPNHAADAVGMGLALQGVL